MNLVANFAGRFWGAAVRLAVIPLYLQYLGLEAFALIGVFATLTALLVVFDLGLSATLTRDLARSGETDADQEELRHVARTLEIIYWSIGLLAAVGIASAAPFIATGWLRPQGLPHETVRLAIVAMAGAIGLQWPVSLYTGGLVGLQQHVALNALTGSMITFQNVGAVMILRFVSPTAGAYFAWQICATAAFAAVFKWYFWRRLSPSGEPGNFRLGLFASRWRFAGGMIGITLTSTVLMQTDKVVLSKVLTLSEFGYYTFAFAVASTLGYVAVPIYTAVYPRLVQLTGRSDEPSVAALYHGAAQLVSVLLIPAAALFSFFPREVLVIYSRDVGLADRAAPLLALLAIGIGLNGLMLLPLALQLAHGWTSLSVWKNVLGTVLYLPALLVLISLYGPAGAAIAFITLNAGYVLFEVPIMHRRVLRSEMAGWYWADVGRPLVATLAVAAGARLVLGTVHAPYLLPYLITVGFAMAGAAALAAPRPLRIALSQVASWR